MISPELESLIRKTVVISDNRVRILDEVKLRADVIDKLVYQAVFG